MTTVTDSQGQQQRIRDLVYDWTNHEQVRSIAARYGLSVRRASGLCAVASVVGGQDTRCALQSAESAARWSRGSAAAAMRHLHRDLPVTSARPRQQFGDGTTIRVTLQTWQPSRARLSGPPRVLPGGHRVNDLDRRERVGQWSLDPAAPVLYRHRGPAVGRITAAELDDTTQDMRAWVTLTDPALTESALYRELSASPGLDASGALDRGFSVRDQEHTRTWTTARVLELSLVPIGTQALGGIQVDLVPGAPAELAAAWASPSIRDWDVPTTRADRQPVYQIRRTADGQAYQTRTWPGLPGLQVS